MLGKETTLLMCSDCPMNALASPKQLAAHRLKGNHSQIGRKCLGSMIQESIDAVTGIAWEKLTQKISNQFRGFRAQIDELENQISEKMKYHKVSYTLNSNNEEDVNAAIKILDIAKDHINVSCKSVFVVHDAIINKKQTLLQQKVEKIELELLHMLEEGFEKISSYKPVLFDDSFVEEPENELSIPLLKPNDHQKQFNKNQCVANLSDVLKGQRFSIMLKVLNIKERFKIDDSEKVLFKAGDNTGIASCVMDNHPLIEENKTIIVTNCRIYLFHGTKQIQSSKESEIVSSKRQIGKVNYEYDLSSYRKKYEKGRKKSEEKKKMEKKEEGYFEQLKKKTTKIYKIEPGASGLNLIAAITNIREVDGNQMVECTLGDETGLVKAYLSKLLVNLEKGLVVYLTNYEAEVVNRHILLKMNLNSCIQILAIKLNRIKFDFNVSALEWLEAKHLIP